MTLFCYIYTIITFDNSIVKQVHCNPRELNLSGRDIVYYMQGLEFEPLTSHFFTIKLCELYLLGYLIKKKKTR